MKNRINFIKVDKKSARRMFNCGLTIHLLPCNFRGDVLQEDSFFGHCKISLLDNKEESSIKLFDNLVNSFTYYNCNSETGTYPHFYVTEEDFASFEMCCMICSMKAEREVYSMTREDTLKQLNLRLEEVLEQIIAFKDEEYDIERRIIEETIKPLKMSDHIMYYVPTRGKVLERECVLETEKGNLYVRPVKPDGSLGGRHFLVASFLNTESLESLIEKKVGD